MTAVTLLHSQKYSDSNYSLADTPSRMRRATWANGSLSDPFLPNPSHSPNHRRSDSTSSDGTEHIDGAFNIPLLDDEEVIGFIRNGGGHDVDVLNAGLRFVC